MTKKKPKRTRTRTPAEIFDMWMEEAQDGLSAFKTRTFDPLVYAKHRPLASAHITLALAGGAQFGKAEEKATKRVAKDLGKICRMIAGGRIVSEDVFDRVRKLLSRTHFICRAGGAGTGAWCDW